MPITILNQLSKPQKVDVLPVGKPFQVYLHKLHDIHFELEEVQSTAAAVIEDEPVPEEYFTLDSKDWREHDHYGIVGLSKLRHLATEDDIRNAYRRRVLKHHPDKKENKDDDAFFKCIQKSFEILSDPVKRKQFESVDPEFDDSVPDVADVQKDFFGTFSKVFKANGVYSTVQPVPELGDLESSKAEVEKFYDFWYNFNSWRSFEFLDEEETENAENRMDKRWLDRKNRAARAKRKTEDNARITKIVDLAMKMDPRIQMFKDQEKAAKLAKKKSLTAKATPQKKSQESNAAQQKEAEAKAAAAEKEQRDIKKKQKEKQKSDIRKQKKAIRAAFSEFGSFADAKASVEQQTIKLEEMLSSLGLEELIDLSRKFEKKETARTAFFSASKDEQESNDVTSQMETKENSKNECNVPEWDVKEIQLLIKAVNQFPGGTQDRWEVIASYVADHSGLPLRSTSDCIARSKNLTADIGSTLQQTEVKKDPRINDSDPTVICREGIWTEQDQILLEKGLRENPSSVSDRWQKIAAIVVTKNAQQCQERFKFIAAQLKKK